MRRIRLKTAMIAIALIAVLLGTTVGLRNRSRRFYSMFLRYGHEADRLERSWVKAPPLKPGEVDLVVDEIHQNDCIANAYLIASQQPWMPFEPNPSKIRCTCRYHLVLKDRSQP